MKKSRQERESKKERMMSRKSGREGRMKRENKSETYLLNRYMNLKQNYVSDLLT